MDDVFVKGDVPTGCYVAIESPQNPIVVGKGSDPVEAYRQALAKGYKNPALLYIPENDSVFVYHARFDLHLDYPKRTFSLNC